MRDNLDELPLAIAITVIIFILVGAVCLTISGNNNLAERNQLCKDRGGVILDQTYQSGKATNHNYVCVRADAIIDIPDQK